MNDLKFILSNNNNNSDTVKHESNINNILDMINKESSIISMNWNKLSKTKKKNLLKDYIFNQKKKLSAEKLKELEKTIIDEFLKGNIKNNDIILDSNGKIDKIKPLKLDEGCFIYKKRIIYSKSNIKSKTNIERILK